MATQNSTRSILLSRSLAPYAYKRKGAGMKTTAINPRTELPQPIPSVSYMLFPAKGSSPPSNDRAIVLAAVTDAAYIVKASMRYVVLAIFLPSAQPIKGA